MNANDRAFRHQNHTSKSINEEAKTRENHLASSCKTRLCTNVYDQADARTNKKRPDEAPRIKPTVAARHAVGSIRLLPIRCYTPAAMQYRLVKAGRWPHVHSLVMQEGAPDPIRYPEPLEPCTSVGSGRGFFFFCGPSFNPL